MTGKELHTYLISSFPKEDEKCEWKEYKSLKGAISGQAGDDVISYISAIANMQGGHLVIGVRDRTLEVVGIQDFSDFNISNIRYRVVGNCVNLNINDFKVEEFVLSDIPEEVYRNPFLVEAMKNLDMIETQGGGIRKIFNFQRQRFFPCLITI